jgi:hypothetical protein
MTKHNIENATVQVTTGKSYDPDHPDADWSGYVYARSHRKHFLGQPNQLCAVIGQGLGPKDDAVTAEWKKPSKKILNQITSCQENKEAKNTPSSTFSLIGGPVPFDSPNLYSPVCWETETQAAARRRKTDLHQLTNHGRSKYVRGKSSCAAAFEKKQPVETCNPKSTSVQCIEQDPSDMVGFRCSPKIISYSDPGFLKSVSETVEQIRKPISPFTTNIYTAFDPYRTVSGERKKDLLVENFRSAVPGYTGKRTFIN